MTNCKLHVVLYTLCPSLPAKLPSNKMKNVMYENGEQKIDFLIIYSTINIIFKRANMTLK